MCVRHVCAGWRHPTTPANGLQLCDAHHVGPQAWHAGPHTPPPPTATVSQLVPFQARTLVPFQERCWWQNLCNGAVLFRADCSGCSGPLVADAPPYTCRGPFHPSRRSTHVDAASHVQAAHAGLGAKTVEPRWLGAECMQHLVGRSCLVWGMQCKVASTACDWCMHIRGPPLACPVQHHGFGGLPTHQTPQRELSSALPWAARAVKAGAHAPPATSLTPGMHGARTHAHVKTRRHAATVGGSVHMAAGCFAAGFHHAPGDDSP